LSTCVWHVLAYTHFGVPPTQSKTGAATGSTFQHDQQDPRFAINDLIFHKLQIPFDTNLWLRKYSEKHVRNCGN